MSDDLEAKLAMPVRNLRIIVAAMVIVPLIFAGVVLLIGSQEPQNPAPVEGAMVERRGGETIGQLALIMGLVAIVAQQFMGRFVTKQAVQNLSARAMGNPERLGEAMIVGTVVSCAINEGAAFLNLIAYMSSQWYYNLGMALLLIASNALKFPSTSRVAAWAKATTEELQMNAVRRAQGS